MCSLTTRFWPPAGTCATRGYLLLLDDYTGRPEFEPFLDVVDWVKVDLRAVSTGESANLARQLKRRKLRLLAEKVETVEERDAALAAGYDFFQGYFLHRPRVVSGRTLNARHNTKLKLLSLLGADQFTLEKVESAIAPDVGLCYRLIEYSNSARFGAPREISSLRQCLMRLGENETRRWMTFVLLPTLAPGRSTEIVDAALTRARMCELLADAAGLRMAKSLAFMAGMFTLMDALLGAPMTEVVQQLGLGEELAGALLGRIRDPWGRSSGLRTPTNARPLRSWNHSAGNSGCSLRLSPTSTCRHCNGPPRLQRPASPPSS
ncbi:MAG: HDOD domain-containing protein [Paludibaculum sp.]